MSWKDLDYDEYLQRKDPDKEYGKEFISGEQFDARLDATSLERYPLRLFTHRQPASKQGMTYYDKENKKVKVYIDETGQWADLQYTTTSTSTSSTTSTSTTTTT
ncbi:MAG: hypothetical protein [Podoviridae sp. ctg2L5]|nr:MAG: hypothetical protein [Podoviridae sp. ctg2L5]